MNRYTINLSSRPFHNNTIHWAGFALVFAGLLAFTWYDIHQFRSSGETKARWTDELEEKRASLDRLAAEAEQINREVSRMDLEELNARSAFANDIILSRLFSWSGLFDKLETVQPELVRIRSLRPRVEGGQIELTVSGATKNHAHLLEFEDNLMRSDFFSLVYPETELSQQKRGEIEFTLKFNYLPEGSVVTADREAGEEDTTVEAAAGEPISLDDIALEEPEEEPAPVSLDEITEEDAEEDSDPNEEGNP